MRKLLFLASLAFVLTPISAFALITGNVSTDIIGNVNYTFSDGTSGYSYKDSAGYTHYQFSNGVYGNAYTDITGNTHYYFDDATRKIYINGTCIYPTAGTCMYESQYQEMYNNALQGLPSCSQSSGEAGSFSVPAESCTPEGRESLIMSGTYGPWLKNCRESITLYTSSKASYDKCVQEQNAKYEQLAQMKLNLLKQQLDLERQRLELQKQQAQASTPTCPTKSHLNSQGDCVCDAGLVWDNNRNACVTCSVFMPNSSAQTYGEITACSCNTGYHYDLTSKSCLTQAEWLKTEQKPTTPFQAVGVELEKQKIAEEQKTNIVPKPTAVTPKTVPVPVKNTVVNQAATSTNTTTITNQNIKQEQKAVQTENQLNETPKKVGIFQKITHGVSGFFKNVFNKIKFW
jgi:hypothetical protein